MLFENTIDFVYYMKMFFHGVSGLSKKMYMKSIRAFNKINFRLCSVHQDHATIPKKLWVGSSGLNKIKTFK